MKAKFYLVAGLSALMLGACSDDSTLDTPQGQEQTVQKEGIMNINLKFAGDDNARSRGWGGQNDPTDNDFVDGKGDENIINKITAYYFESGNGNNFIGRGEAVNWTEGPGVESNIEKKITVAVPAAVTEKLNNNGKVEVIIVLNEPKDLSPADQKKNYESFNKALSTASLASSVDKDNLGFMMSSSLYSQDAKDLTAMVKFMEIDNDYVAEVGKAPDKTATAYVERVCSRVGLTTDANLSTNANFDVKGWVLNVRNTNVYPVKKITTLTTALQSENQNITDTYWPGADDWTSSDAVTRHRCYWAEDPNYQTATVTSEFTLAKFTDMKTLNEAPTYYCLENTMNYDQQKENQTTTAVVLATYVPKRFYGEKNDHTWGADENKTWAVINNAYYTWNDYIKTFLAHNQIYTKTVDNGNITWNSATLDDVSITGNKEGEVTTQTTQAEQEIVIGYKSYDIALKNGTELYKKTGNGNTADDYTKITDGNQNSNFEDFLKTPFTEYQNQSTIYYNGYCYYEILIRHFNDTELGKLEADWKGEYTQKHLGRYGVVRNHVYNLTIKGVSKPGKPIQKQEITPGNGTDDPTKEYAMTVDINVLRWAVRSQDVNL